MSSAKMEGNAQRRRSGSGQISTPSSLRNCLYPPSPAATIERGSKSLRHSSKSKNKSEPPRPPPAFNRVKGRINMESPTKMGSGADLYLQCRSEHSVDASTEVPWLQDTSPTNKTPRTPLRSRSHTPDPNASFVNPSSALLQDLLKEQRASRGARSGGLEELENSPQRTPEWCQSQSLSNSQDEVGSEKQKANKMSSNGSVRRPPEMGVRETDQYISKISKQNFDLKLEIFYRVQQLSTLEKKLERMDELEEEVQRMRGLEDEVQELRAAQADNQRLLETNEQLEQEIDKRDQAVTEAVDLICQLEARMEELGMDLDVSRPSATYTSYGGDSGVATPRNASTVDIPERTSSRGGVRRSERRQVSSGSRYLQRAPSFLLEESKSTAALRSLYVEMDDNPLPEPAAITKSESMNSMGETTEPESPRLSALSECSELNIHDSPIVEDGFDQIDIPVRRNEICAQDANLSSSTIVKSSRDLARMDRWNPMEADNSFNWIGTQQRTRRLSDVFKEPETSSPNSSFNGSSKSKMESIFGSARLPPTPDTMVTGYPGWANSSSNSTIADKGQSDPKQLFPRPRSVGELTAKRSSINGEPRESLDTNMSKVTLPRSNLDEREEDPAILPLNSIQVPYGYTENHGILPGDFDRVLDRMNKEYYSPSRQTSRDETASLTADDWIEAGRPGTQNRTPLPIHSRVVRTRAPSQCSFLGRRHSIDSAVREPTLPIIQTLNPRVLEEDGDDGPAPTPETAGPEPEQRRRISLLPQFFSRSGNSRRLQPSPMPEPIDKDDGAPSPVIRKTRNQPSKAPRPSSGQAYDFSASGPTYAEDSMPRSFTEANLSSSYNSTTSRPSTSNGGKDHKRRGSLGLFGWMKGASSGLGSSLKKSDAASFNPPSSTKSDFPITPATTSAAASTRASSRIATHDNVTFAPGQEPTKPAAAEPVVEEFATRTRHPTRSEEPADEHGRRPRYMERRSRRT